MFWTYQLDSTANQAHLPQKLAKLAELAALFSWYVAPKWPQVFFSIAMGVEPSF
jgi:hypothetical protein